MTAAPALAPLRVRLGGFYAASFLATGIQLPFWPVWLAGRGLDAREIALVFAAAIWAKVATTPGWGALADRSGHRRAVMAALAGCACLAYLALGAARGFAAILALNLIAGSMLAAVLPIGDSITLAAMRRDGIDYGRVRLWGSIGFTAAASGTGAILAGSGGRSGGVLWLMLAATLLLALICLVLPDEVRARSRGRGGGLGALARDRRFWLFIAVAALLQASHQVYYGFGTLYWRSQGFSDTAIGALWAEAVVAEIALFWQGRRLAAWCGPGGLLALAGLGGIVRWGLTGIVPGLPAAAALQLLHALTFGAAHLGAMHFLARTVPPEAGATAQSLYAAISSGLGGGLVMLAAGALYADYGGRAYLAMALLSALALALAAALREKHL